MRFFKLAWGFFRQYGSDIKYLILLPLIPVVALLALQPIIKFVYEETAAANSFQIAVVNGSGSQLVNMAVSAVMQSDSISGNLKIIKVSEAEAKEGIESGEITAAILLPPDFIERMEQGEEHSITVLTSGSRPMEAALFKQSMQSTEGMMTAVQNTLYMISKYSGQISEDLFERSMITLIFQTLGRDKIYEVETLSAFGEQNALIYYGQAVLLVFLSFISSLYCVFANSDVQWKRISRRMRSLGSGITGLWTAQGAGAGLLLFFQAILPFILLTTMAGSFSMLNFLTGMAALLFICLAMGLLSMAAVLAFGKNSAAAGFLLGAHCLSILLSGIILPPGLVGKISGAVRIFSPHHYWFRALQLSFGGAAGSGVGAVLILLPVMTILLIGGMLYAGRDKLF